MKKSRSKERLGSGRSRSSKKRDQIHERTGGHFKPHKKIRATVDKNRRGFAFLIADGKKSSHQEDLFIPPHQASELFHGDRVEATVTSRGRVEDIRVIAHRYQELVGRYTPSLSPGRAAGWVIYEKKNAREEICILRQPIPRKGPIRAGDWVRVKLHFHTTGEYSVTGDILEVYGKDLPPSADVSMVAAEFGLVEEHAASAVEEAKTKTLQVPGKDQKGRKDLRHVPFITIDGETARDFDDAVYVEQNEKGYILWVAIADVSHYVREGSALDQEARSRGTSVYFPERAFHMLPRELSENLCSLVPDEPRLTLVARMWFDQNGRNRDTEVYEGIIQSKRRATYNQIQKEWLENQNNPNWKYKAHFELFHILKRTRTQRGSIEFDLPEPELNVTPQGEVVSIKHRQRFEAHKLIEEFMIAANEAVTRWMMKRRWPFVYRIHEEPSPEALERFRELAATVGVQFWVEPGASPKVLAEVVQRLEGHPAESLLNMALLRSMKQAVYSETHGIHYGLASEAYTHFTSPIRRYPDLVVHRLLRQVIQKGGKNPKLSPQERSRLEKSLAEICEHCSYRERLAADAERESIKLKQVRMMVAHLGDEFDAKIVGMISSGLFVQIENPYVEGMVAVESIADDFYEFNEERMVFFGRRKKRTFRIGDGVRIRVVRADIEKRQIDFTIIENTK
ncbi:MAG: ribonuclease R [Bdellovibrio sp.]|nr:ribonuclease R [Bdellovibrio sp.]